MRGLHEYEPGIELAAFKLRPSSRANFTVGRLVSLSEP